MKNLINKNCIMILLASLGSINSHAQSVVSGESDYSTYWRQFSFNEFQSGGGPMLDVNITGQTTTSDPSLTTGAPIPLDGSVFQLYVVHNTTGNAQIVGEAFGAPFQLTGNININREDPWVKIGENGSRVYRSRVDWNFGLSVSVQGLKSEDEFVTYNGERIPFPINLREARWGETVYQHNDDFEPIDATSFDVPVVNVLANDVSGNQELVVYPNNTNSGYNLYNTSNPEPERTSGEYHFQLRTVNQGMNSSGEASVYANAIFKVFPKTQVSIIGVSHRNTYSVLPSISVDLANLYPKSDTEFTVVKLNDDWSESGEEPIAVAVPKVLDGEEPESFREADGRAVPLNLLSSAVTEAGKYRIKVKQKMMKLNPAGDISDDSNYAIVDEWATEDLDANNVPDGFVDFAYVTELNVNAGVFSEN